MSVEVLVVDEDEDVLAVTGTFLARQDGLTISTESDPERALERVTDGEFEAVVSDFSMPKLDGLELCQRIRDAGCDVPFVLFSGRDEKTIECCRGTECVTEFVTKGTGTDQYESLAAHILDAVE